MGVGKHTEMRNGGKSSESWFESLIGHSEMHMGIGILLMSESTIEIFAPRWNLLVAGGSDVMLRYYLGLTESYLMYFCLCTNIEGAHYSLVKVVLFGAGAIVQFSQFPFSIGTETRGFLFIFICSCSEM